MSCCCCVGPSREQLKGMRKSEWLVTEEEEEEDEEDDEGSRRNMDISLLAEQYRSTRETQRRQMLLVQMVSDELSKAVSVVSVRQGPSPPWGSGRGPVPTFDSDPAIYDPWLLGQRRCTCPSVNVQLPVFPPRMTNSCMLSPFSSSFSSSSGGRKLSESTTSCFSSTKDEEDDDYVLSDGTSDGGAEMGSPGVPCVAPVQVHIDDPGTDVPQMFAGDFSKSMDRLQASLGDPGVDLVHTSFKIPSIVLSDASSAVPSPCLADEACFSIEACGAAGLRDDPDPDEPACRKFLLSAAKAGSSPHHNQVNYPFPNRRLPRISEAAKRLGLYSSF